MTKQPKIEILAEKEKLVEGITQNVDVLVRITPPEPDDAVANKQKLNLGIALDRSGSMQGAKMKEARDAAKFCVDNLQSTDRFSAVIFDDQVDVLFTNQFVTDRAMLHRGIDRIDARNSTALHEGWVKAGIQVSEHLDPDAINRVLLITDGQANVGETNVDRIVSQARDLAEKGISTTTIGIGRDFNEDLLLPMAEAGGGNGWHVQEPEDMVKIFETELNGLSRQLGNTVRLRIKTVEGVRVTDLLNDFQVADDNSYILPNLLSGSPLEIVVRLEVQSSIAGKELFTVGLEYIRQSDNEAAILEASYAPATADRESVENLDHNADVIRSLQVLLNARARGEAVLKMAAGDRDGAIDGISFCLASSLSLTEGAPDAFHEELADLEEIRESLKDGDDDVMARKRMAYRRESLRKGR